MSLLRATTVEIQPLDLTFGIGGFTADGIARVSEIDDVNAGVAWEVQASTPLPVSTTVVRDRLGEPRVVAIYAASEGLFDASQATLQAGRVFDRFCVDQVPYALRPEKLDPYRGG